MRRTLMPLLMLLLLVSSVAAQQATIPIPSTDEYVDWRYVQDMKIQDHGGFLGWMQTFLTPSFLFAISASDVGGAEYMEVGSPIKLSLDKTIQGDWTSVMFLVGTEMNGQFAYVYANLWTVCEQGCDLQVPYQGSQDVNLVAYFTPGQPGQYTAIFRAYKTDQTTIESDERSFYVIEPGADDCPASYCGQWVIDNQVVGGTVEHRDCHTYEFNLQTYMCEDTISKDYRVSCFDGYEVNDEGDGCDLIPPTCTDTDWAPLRSEVCSGSTFTQTSNCDNTRVTTGTKDCTPQCEDSTWSPLASTICEGSTFIQYSNCQNQRTAVGTKVCQTQCEDTEWLPAQSSVCEGLTFTQTSNCQNQRVVQGTKDCTPICTDSTWTPLKSTVCDGQLFTQYSNCQNERAATGTKDCTPVCTSTEWLPLKSAVCAGMIFTQTSNCGETRHMSGTKDCSWTCNPSSWLPDDANVCDGVTFTQTSNCGTTRFAVGDKDCSVQCTSTSWLPAPNAVCDGVDFDQTSNCGITRSATGTKDCSAPSSGDSTCTSGNWGPSASSYCEDLEFVQVNDCGDTRIIMGTKDCTVGSADDNSDENTDETGDQGDLLVRLLILGGVGYGAYWLVTSNRSPLNKRRRRR